MSDPACKYSASLFEPAGNLSRAYLEADPPQQVLSEFIRTRWEFWKLQSQDFCYGAEMKDFTKLQNPASALAFCDVVYFCTTIVTQGPEKKECRFQHS